MAVGILAMTFVVFAKPLTPLIPALEPLGRIAWPWYVLIGTSITMLVGFLSSLVGSRGAPTSATTG